MQAVNASFLVLPAASRRVYESAEDRVAPTPHQGSHVQRGPQAGSATPDRPSATHRAAVSIERSQPNERGDLFAAEGPELGQVRQQRRVALTTGPMPGTLRKRFSCSRHSGLLRMACLSSWSTPFRRLRSQVMCSWISARIGLGAPVLRPILLCGEHLDQRSAAGDQGPQ